MLKKVFSLVMILVLGSHLNSQACTVIAVGKIEPENITPELITEKTYGSFFLPPDLIILTGKPSINGFLLWSCAKSNIYLSKNNWKDFSKTELEKAIKSYSEN